MNTCLRFSPKRSLTAGLCVIICAVLLFVIPSVTGAASTTITVCPTGATYRTIQSAIDNATSGALVQVCAATYHENIVLRNGVSIQGAGRGTRPSSTAAAQTRSCVRWPQILGRAPSGAA